MSLTAFIGGKMNINTIGQATPNGVKVLFIGIPGISDPVNN